MPSAGRTSMPSTLPATPVMFQVFTTFFWLVSTIEMVLSPDKRGDLGGLRGGGGDDDGRRRGQNGLDGHGKLPWFAVARLRLQAGTERSAGRMQPAPVKKM